MALIVVPEVSGNPKMPDESSLRQHPLSAPSPRKLFSQSRNSVKHNISSQHNLTTSDDRPQSSHSFAKVSLPVASRLILFSSHSAAGSAFLVPTSSLRAAPRVTALYITTQLRTYASKKKKMPPKKEVKQEKVLLGRPGNSLKSGIVCTAKLCVLCACALDNILMAHLGWSRQCRQVDILPGNHQVPSR